MNIPTGDIAQMITAVAALASVVVSWRNGRKLDTQGEKLEVVHLTTNSLAQRNEEIAKQLGIEQGKASEKASNIRNPGES